MRLPVGTRVEVSILPAALVRRWNRAIAERLNGAAGEVLAEGRVFCGIEDDWREVSFDLPVRLAQGGDVYRSLVLRAADLKEIWK